MVRRYEVDRIPAAAPVSPATTRIGGGRKGGPENQPCCCSTIGPALGLREFCAPAAHLVDAYAFVQGGSVCCVDGDSLIVLIKAMLVPVSSIESTSPGEYCFVMVLRQAGFGENT